LVISAFVVLGRQLAIILCFVLAVPLMVRAEGQASVYDIESKWVDQQGKPLAFKAPGIQWTVLSMAYTSCESSCPLIIQKMQGIEKKLPTALDGKVRFLVFSFDGKRDTVPVLAAYTVKRKLTAGNWFLLTAPEDEARTLASILDFRYKQLANGDFSHSNQITLLDHSGRIVAQASDLVTAPETLLEKILSPASK